MFLIAQCIKNIVGKDHQAEKRFSGDVLVEVYRQNQSENHLKQVTLAHIKVIVTPHHSLNEAQGKISERELLHKSEDDLLEGLQDQGVKAVRRITTRRAG